MYTSEQAHSSVEKAGIALGLGRKGVAKIGVDHEFKMDTGALEAAIERDKADGWRPFAVSATVGARPSTTSIDPTEAIAEVCERHGLWLHVDAAYAGAAAILPRKARHPRRLRSRRFVRDGTRTSGLFTPIDWQRFILPATGCAEARVQRQSRVFEDAGR